MRTVTKIIVAGQISKVLLRSAPVLLLPFHERSKSRLRITISTGEEIAISLPRGTVMRGGDALVAEDGHFIQVVADKERVLRVTASHAHDLLRAAYHLGNRHVPVEIGVDYLHLEFDAVLFDMLTHLGVCVEQAWNPFEPEHGAYGGGHKHGHDESFDEDYALAQSVFHVHHEHRARPDGEIAGSHDQ